jgi:hypothetical protein
MRDIEFDVVKKKVDDLFETSVVEQRLALEGPYRLYGKAYS